MSPLTDEQAAHLAQSLHGGCQNIFRAAERVLGRATVPGTECDAIYEHVCRVGDLFKCAYCNEWCYKSEGTTTQDDMCAECEDTGCGD